MGATPEGRPAADDFEAAFSAAQAASRPAPAQGLLSVWAAAVKAAADVGALDDEDVEDELGPAAHLVNSGYSPQGGDQEDSDDEPPPLANAEPGGTTPVRAEPPPPPPPEEKKELDASELGFLGLLSAWSDGDTARKLLDSKELKPGAFDEQEEKKPKRVPNKPPEAGPAPKGSSKPLTPEQVAELKAQFPKTKAPMPPPESKRWTALDFQLYFGSGGALKPRDEPWPCTDEALAQEIRDTAQGSPLLGRMRMYLAEENVSKAPPEYVSLCNFVRAAAGNLRAVGLAEMVEMKRVRNVPDVFTAPVCVEAKRNWRPKRWGMPFWAMENGESLCNCVRRYPQDLQMAVNSLEVRVDDFIKYVNVVRDVDPQCHEGGYLAYPRFMVGSWSPFATSPTARKLWQEDWYSHRKLWAPPGLKDKTPRWVRICCDRVRLDWEQAIASLDRLQMLPPGAVMKLHTENSRANAWYAQIQGRRSFLLFPPEDRVNLYVEEGQEVVMGSDERQSQSPVDVLRTSEKVHPKFQQCKAHVVVLEPGETLVIPTGWWHFSIALEPCTTLVRKFWDKKHRVGICDEVATMLMEQDQRPQAKERAESQLKMLRDELLKDDSSGEEMDP